MSVPKVGSLFAGVGGFDMGLEAAGFEVAWQVEIDKDAVSVLERHYPNVRRYRDVVTVDPAELEAVDVVTFGSPCQDMSVAGKRAGLAGERSGLFYEAVRIIGGLRPAPAFCIWENVPGALSSAGGRDFGAALDALADIGALDIAWRVLDAQWWGVPQRRRRIFLVADFGGERAASVLFEPPGMRGDSQESGAEGQRIAGVPEDGAGGGGLPDVSFTLRGNDNGTGSSDNAWNTTYVAGMLSPGAHPGGLNGQDAHSGHLIAAPLTAGGHPNSNMPGRHREDDENLVVSEVAAFNWQAGGGGNDDSFRGKSRQYIERAGDYAGALSATRVDAIAFTNRGKAVEGAHETLRAASHGALPMVAQASVRRLMPVECERLMGWPDGHTERRADGSLISDGPRYRMIGNGVVAPVARWIGERLMHVMGETHAAI